MKFVVQRKKQPACTLTLTNLGGGDWEISYLQTEVGFKYEGLARIAITRAERFADKIQARLVGLVDPDKSQNGLTSDQIKAWLARRGYKPFRYEFGDWKRTFVKSVMMRDPKADL